MKKHIDHLINRNDNSKSKYDNKFIRKTIRFTPNEYQLIDEQLASLNINFTKFARNAILKNKIILPIQIDLIYELNRIGNNLNQIAKAINSGEKIAILTQLVAIEKELHNLQYKD